MRRIKHSLASNPHSHRNVVLWAASCCTRFFDFLRCTEFLTPDDVHFNLQVYLRLDDLVYRHAATPPHVEVWIKVSKTDQFRQGTAVVLGATGSELCLVVHSTARLPWEEGWVPRSSLYQCKCDSDTEKAICQQSPRSTDSCWGQWSQFQWPQLSNRGCKLQQAKQGSPKRT